MKKVHKHTKFEVVFYVVSVLVILGIVAIGFVYMNNNKVQTETDSNASAGKVHVCQVCTGQKNMPYRCKKPVVSKTTKSGYRYVTYCSGINQTGQKVVIQPNLKQKAFSVAIECVRVGAEGCTDRATVIELTNCSDSAKKLALKDYVNVSCKNVDYWKN